MAFRIDIDSLESWVSRHARAFILLVAALVAFVGVVAIVVFFIALRGAEQALVPDIRGKELTAALLELQAKELYPRIQLRHSQDAQDRGLILEQDPRPGTIVKAGRRIRLVVSQGVQVNTIEDYRGRNIDEVTMDLRSLYASSAQPLLSIADPPLYEYSDEPAGAILVQRPEPGTAVTGPLTLEFVVSRGPEHVLISVPALTGLSAPAALGRLREAGLRSEFTLLAGGSAGIVVSQTPGAGTALESSRPVRVMVSAGDAALRLFEYTLAESPVPLPVRLEYLPPGGSERIVLAEADFSGGVFTFPYQVPPGSTLIFSVMGRELHRETVLPAVDEFSLDEL
ncbi:MAG: PASTA domain-containing protein [Spirochaetaceae bacterium]|jgi:beta-lactam-binding protein with PASTA domain|nr:PASTA domain-containing protein [Spirochaetaceae bacterium]